MSNNSKQVDLASDTLKVFEDHGEDMNDTRHVVHYMYGGNFEALGAALRELGYAVRPTVGNDGVVAERHEVIGEEWRTSTLAHLCEIADQYGVEYDGWEASMTRQSTPEAQDNADSKLTTWLARIFGKKH